MKKAIIVHGWGGSPEELIHKWLKKELERKNYLVIAPEMPNTDEPEIRSWVSKLEEVAEDIDEETLLIGHSIGCQTIMRFLEKSDFIEKVKVIFIAGWFKLGNLEDEEIERIAKPWLETEIDLKKVKSKINRLVVFLSDNEPYGFVDYNSEMFKEKLNAEIIVLNNKGHFSEDTGVTQLPEILDFI